MRVRTRAGTDNIDNKLFYMLLFEVFCVSTIPVAQIDMDGKRLLFLPLLFCFAVAYFDDSGKCLYLHIYFLKAIPKIALHYVT